MQDEFIAQQCLVQVLFELHAFQGFTCHRLGVNGECIAAPVLGFTHRDVRIAQQHVDRFAVARIHANPYAGCDMQILTLEFERLVERTQDLLRDARRLQRRIDVLEQQGGLVPTDTRDPLGFFEARFAFF